ncbi:MAG: DUF5916 domain-containing protein [Gemmatimonadaceae bacterium]
MLSSLVFAGALLVDSTFTLAAKRVTAPPRIDGTIDGSEWGNASLAQSFLQFQPRRGDPASQRTDALVAYDSTHIYIAFRVFDTEEPTGQLTRRDAELLDDDAVIVLLDTYRDRQSGYYFVTNLLGTQADGRIADDGRTVDGSWDASWRSAARRSADGWQAELAIPLASIAFRAGDARAWGINFGRSRRRTLERSFWAGPLDNAYRMSQAGTLEGLSLTAPPKRHQLILYGLTRAQDGEAGHSDAGVDLRFALTPQMAFTGTLNPDFATIEADEEQVNLTRFEVSLAEKRPFFLEGSELFRQRIRTFYTRRITDIRGGAKLYGKQGPWTLAGIYADASPSGTTPEARYSIVRAQRDLGRSNVAFMLAERDTTGEHQGSAGLDANLFFTKTLGMTAQAIQSYGPFTGGATAFFLRPSYDSPTGHFHVRYTHLGERFADNANVVGFIRDDDRREFDSAIEKTLWIRRGAFERLGYDSNYNIFWSQSGTLRAWEIIQNVAVDLRNRLSANVQHIEDLQRFEEEFRNRRTGITVGYNTREYQSVQVGYEFGRNFNSDLGLVTALARYKVTDELSLEYELERLTLSPDPDTASTWIHVARLNQFFTKDLFLRLFYQTNSVIERRNVQAVFVWRYLPPFGTLQLAFQRGTAAFGTRSEQGNTLFLKATAVF